MFSLSCAGSASPTPPVDKKSRAHSSDSSRKSRIDHQNNLATTIQRLAAPRQHVQPAAQPTSSSSSGAATPSTGLAARIKSAPQRPNHLVGVAPSQAVEGGSTSTVAAVLQPSRPSSHSGSSKQPVAGPPIARGHPSRPLRTPSPKTMSTIPSSSSRQVEKKTHRVLPSPMRPAAPKQDAGKNAAEKPATEVASKKPPISKAHKV